MKKLTGTFVLGLILSGAVMTFADNAFAGDRHHRHYRGSYHYYPRTVVVSRPYYPPPTYYYYPRTTYVYPPSYYYVPAPYVSTYVSVPRVGFSVYVGR